MFNVLDTVFVILLCRQVKCRQHTLMPERQITCWYIIKLDNKNKRLDSSLFPNLHMTFLFRYLS